MTTTVKEKQQATINLDLVYRKDTNFESDLNPLHRLSASAKKNSLSKLNLKILQEHLTVQFDRLTKHVALVRYFHPHSRDHDPKSLKELEDGAASIISELLRQPRIIVDVLSYLRNDPVSTTTVISISGIVINRILHPFFNDNSATTALLFEMLAWQAEECQSTMHNSDRTTTDSKQFFARALFIDDPSFLEEWDPLEQPLPVIPNCSSETLLTTLLKSYSLRMDITWFFRDLWTPVLPSVVAFLGLLPSPQLTGFQTSQLEDGEVFKSAMKTVNRLLLHTFSEKSMIGWPPTATAIGESPILPRLTHSITHSHGNTFF